MTLLAILLSPAHAEDATVWAGAGGDSGMRVDNGGVGIVTSQVELDLRAASGPLYLRLDLDVHTNPGAVPLIAPFPVTPEEAFLQIGRRDFRVRLGVSNPNLGLQEWDAWLNYFPTYGINFDFQPGQVAGGDVSMLTASGWELGVYGGYDMGWGYGIAGAYAATEQDAWSTWSGIAAWPGLGYYAIFPAFEFYPTEWLWLDLDFAAGVVGAATFASGQVIANFFPESVPNPTIRVQKSFDPGNAAAGLLGLMTPDTSFSVGLNVDATEFLRFSGEGRVDWYDGEAEGKGILYVAFHPVAPDDDYATMDDESAPALDEAAGE